MKHDNDYRNRDDYDERITEADEGVGRSTLWEPSEP